MDEHFYPLGVCQRVFNFISRFISPLIPSASSGSIEDPGMNGVCSMDETHEPKILSKSSREEMLNHQDQKMSKDDSSGSTIEINFKQSEESLEYWTPIDKLGSSIHVDHDPLLFEKGGDISSTSSTIDPVKNKTIEKGKKSKVAEQSSAKDKKSRLAEPFRNKEKHPLVQVNFTSLPQGMKRADPTSQARGFQETPQVAQGRGRQKVVTTDNKGKNIASDKITVLVQAKEPKMRNPGNILSANINEKSDEFIRSRKEAMRRHLGLGPEA
ncbi:conserved hypothetical protein [Ricinus communis]|uniref:Uncharacterized protein n=1 Tax=Ricinus communis TaxID=3988 RepID=B9SFN2_RICCO|nr:conserved hypothetical protein [Ricinus communis]